MFLGLYILMIVLIMFGILYAKCLINMLERIQSND
jgi:hypothetical protein